MEFRKHPSEILDELINIAHNEYDDNTKKLCEDALYDLYACAQNPRNRDSFHAIYSLLEDVLEARETQPKDKIYIEVEGGAVQNVYTSGVEVSVILCDHDNALQEKEGEDAMYDTNACRELDMMRAHLNRVF